MNLGLAGLLGHGPRRDANVQRGGAPCCVWLTTLLALGLALLPTLALAAPPLSPLWLGPPGLTAAETVLARQNPTVRIVPATAAVRTGETFTISVMIEEAEDLGAFEFTMLFANTIVRVDDITLGDFPGSTGRTVVSVGPTIDNQAGMASFGAVTAGSAIPGPSGTGVLATATLTSQAAGESPLGLQGVVVLALLLPGKPQLEQSVLGRGAVRLQG